MDTIGPAFDENNDVISQKIEATTASVVSDVVSNARRDKTNIRKEYMPVVTDIVGIGPFLDFVNSSEHHQQQHEEKTKQLCVIKYHSKFCNLCRRVDLKYRKLALQFGDVVSTADYHNNPSDTIDDNENDSDDIVTVGKVKFGNVELTTNRQLCDSLEIPKYPYVEMYEDGRLVASFATGPVYHFGVVVRDNIVKRLGLEGEEREREKNSDEQMMIVKERRELLARLKREYLSTCFGA
eukprot:CAMPEP_0172505256 /NCGR_PEP_ID=MMETSP1066-20121228/184893_1 /TAXON_ID=671091 /ORGANISM="Coscinodiscus wailesii, Strain CCMP2513" /LENGTH=237 /DNA_ID=CAMNT_0013281793 /DNA_START=225 /DNA_END=938 /DNA_ORIENTATION=+